METTNVGHNNEETVTTNMIITYPGKDGIKVLENEQIVKIKKYLDEVGSLKAGVTSNTKKEIEAYLAKYNPEKLKEIKAKETEGR